MDAASQCTQLPGRFDSTSWLGEKDVSNRECLISTDHVSFNFEQRDRERLLASQKGGNLARRNQRRALLSGTLVDIGRYRFKLDASFTKQYLPRPAL